MKTIQENLKLFYLGLKNNEPFLYKNKDLTTHAAIIGMTGSGKTGLGITLLEEACIDNIPSIIIDPKGDMTNLALTFSQMSADDFLPYIDKNEAENRGLSVEEFATKQSLEWKDGLENSYQSLQRVELLKNSADFKIYTPKSNYGIGVALLTDFISPKNLDQEEFSEYISSITSSVLSLIGLENDIGSKEHLLILNIFATKFNEGIDVSLEELINFIARPPFSKIGVFDIEQFYPNSERMKLAIKLNTLLASPDFRLWLSGERLDVSKMFFNKNGKARCNIFTISHLSDNERMFFVTLLLNEIIAWMRKSEGTSSLRAILYMDEIFGFFPANANPPSKTPMLTLLKQARAFGLGVVLSTQNPVDLDYKGLSNIGTWFIGRLQTAQDKARVIDGITGISGSSLEKNEIENLISNLAKRHFLVKNINEDGLSLISTRWALSYLKGPLSREQISNLMHEQKNINFINKPFSEKSTSKPILSPNIEQIYDTNAGNELVPNLYARAKVRFFDNKKAVELIKEISFVCELNECVSKVDWMKASECKIATKNELDTKKLYLPLPSFVANSKDFKVLQKEFKEFIYRNYKLSLFNALELSSNGIESKEEFYIRLSDKCNEILEEQTEKITEKLKKDKMKLEEKLNRSILKLKKEQSDVQISGIKAAIDIGTSIIGVFFGKSVVTRSNIGKVASGVGLANKVLKERGDVRISEQEVENLQTQIDELIARYENDVEALKERYDVKNLQIQTIEISPKNNDIYDESVVLLWR